MLYMVYWKEEGSWIGYLQEYPDYWTQGETLADLKEHLKDLYKDLNSPITTGNVRGHGPERLDMQDHPGIKAVEMTRRIRDAHHAELEGKTPEERIAFYREKARALHAELGACVAGNQKQGRKGQQGPQGHQE